MSTRITAGLADAPTDVDVVVVGLGATGAGVALDAVSRGLSVLAVDAHDLAFGTSRWSSKLVHGGLRYLARGQFGVAHESATERDVLMRVTAPHLVRAMPYVVPFNPQVAGPSSLGGSPAAGRGLTVAGVRAGDLLRRAARTPSEVLPRPRRVGRTEILTLAPALSHRGLSGGMLSWDGQLEDDARLVITVARTAADLGAHVRTRARALAVGGREVRLRDEITGAESVVRCRAVVNAAGVWAGTLDGAVRLRPSRGTHLVLRGAAIPGLRTAVFAPVPGGFNKFVMVLPQPDGTLYAGLTDEPLEGPLPDVPDPTEGEIEFLLGVLGATFQVTPTRADVVGAFAGLRPLLDGGSGAGGATSDLSRRHAVLTHDGVTTVVGGKLTTYRRMAADAVDAVIATTPRLVAGPCRTRSLPLAGAASRDVLDALVSDGAPARLVRRYGTDAALVLDTARRATGLSDVELLAPVADGVPTCLAELVFGVTHEGAYDAADLLERRTRVALIPADTHLARPAADVALGLGLGV